MNVKTMKAIDQLAGVPVCLLLDLADRAGRLFPRSAERKPSRILVMKFFGMGSIMQASPMLRAVRTHFSEARLCFLTFAANRDVVERLGVVDEVLVLRTDSFSTFLLDLFRVLGTIRKLRFDITIDMEFFSKFSTIVTYLSGSPVRIGYFLRQLWRGDLLTHQVYYNQHRHIGEVFAALVEPLGVRVTDYSLSAPRIAPSEEAEAASLLEAAGVNTATPLVAFNVNAGELSSERRWPMESFRELARGMLAESDCSLIFIGTPDEAGYVDSVLAGMGTLASGRIFTVAGRTGIGELLALLQRCRLLITNDSGPLHLAASLGVATVSFFGPETPALYAPQGDKHLVFYKGVYCSPCLNVFNVKTAHCGGDNICLKSLEVDEVLQGILGKFPDIRCNKGGGSA